MSIQLLVSTGVDIQEIKDAENDLPTFQLARVSEMVDGWLILIEEKDDWDSIELAIEEQGDITIVGSYYDDGTQVEWGNSAENIKRGHAISKYSSKLKPKRVYDEDGELVEEIPYTEVTALDKQVNLIAGHSNRILN